MTLPIKPQKKVRRIHLANDTGGRSRCRYTSRPSVRATFVPLADFMTLPQEVRCVECERKAKDADGGTAPAV
ncbi:hypothetical protein [Burkholderia vietnamiensis]|uniref:hypothetical protein n=1 Tax=Burkholderia cepacia complex TaxID=87882 RepID=UPI0015948E20|nr:hypothetical protein [Burkholderia vietnamiensis]